MKVQATSRTAAGLPTGKLAVWWVIASEVPIFGGLLASYLMNRVANPGWSEGLEHLNLWIGAFNTLVLISSSLVVMLAHAAAARGDGQKAAARLRLTAAGGALFLCIKAYEWSVKIRAGHVPSAGGLWQYYFSATGLHAAHILVGITILLIVAAGAAKGKELQRVELIGLYWHFVDVVWVALFHLFYIVR
jgi:heme/copper-type cytochrome/quinol oxidase subunit 3